MKGAITTPKQLADLNHALVQATGAKRKAIEPVTSSHLFPGMDHPAAVAELKRRPKTIDGTINSRLPTRHAGRTAKEALAQTASMVAQLSHYHALRRKLVDRFLSEADERLRDGDIPSNCAAAQLIAKFQANAKRIEVKTLGLAALADPGRTRFDDLFIKISTEGIELSIRFYYNTSGLLTFDTMTTVQVEINQQDPDVWLRAQGYSGQSENSHIDMFAGTVAMNAVDLLSEDIAPPKGQLPISTELLNLVLDEVLDGREALRPVWQQVLDIGAVTPALLEELSQDAQISCATVELANKLLHGDGLEMVVRPSEDPFESNPQLTVCLTHLEIRWYLGVINHQRAGELHIEASGSLGLDKTRFANGTNLPCPPDATLHQRVTRALDHLAAKVPGSPLVQCLNENPEMAKQFRDKVFALSLSLSADQWEI
ncbi:hypothetical protein [Ferrimonas marina]|uniref:Uncharacterized protein n=1 Tax=Ferrimonas marina TaxID=299255 RepID=A0A1M5U410_9GAMM|nr:hypothetical protein [Ferrimonas marina]SHH57694.1 hypothetical protein SAMN02745129_2399 [Ferrimonas marina]